MDNSSKQGIVRFKKAKSQHLFFFLVEPMHKQPQYGANGVNFSLFINASGYNTIKF